MYSFIIIQKKGDKGRKMYMILSGEIAILIPHSKEDQKENLNILRRQSTRKESIIVKDMQELN